MFFLWGRFADVRGAWILQRLELATEGNQPQCLFSRGTKQNKMRLWSRVNNDAEKPLWSGGGGAE